MYRTRIKICGVTNVRDSALAVAAGADAVGVVFAPSPRQVSVEEAAKALAVVPSPVARVGVFVDPSLDEVEAAVSVCGLTVVQLNGGESPELCSTVPVPVVKALAVGTDFGFVDPEPYRGHAAALLFDTYVTGKAGGTSQTFDWHTIGALPGWAPSFIAGGLSPANVAECISALHPFGVDVSSGVEVSPGVKDPEKITAFCAAVRRADLEVE